VSAARGKTGRFASIRAGFLRQANARAATPKAETASVRLGDHPNNKSFANE